MERIRVEIHERDNLRDPSRPWCVQWQTIAMPAPAFWYYPTYAEASRTAESLKMQRSPEAHA